MTQLIKFGKVVIVCIVRRSPLPLISFSAIAKTMDRGATRYPSRANITVFFMTRSMLE